MTEITTMWFLVVMLGQIQFGGLYWYDTEAECQAARASITGHVQGAKCVPQPKLNSKP